MMNHEARKRTSYNASVSCVSARSPCNSDILPESSAPSSILIVDDDEDCRELLCTVLENRGFICRQAENGKSALKVIRETWIALIITDFQMPVMNGCEFLEQLSLEKPHPPPAYMITGDLTETIRHRALKAGAIMVLQKPIDPNHLSSLVQLYIR
jgi:CheY-like chemotaxis protein